MFVTAHAGCGGGDDGVESGNALSFSALKVGTTWTYDNTDLNAAGGPKMTTVTKEITNCQELTIVDCVTKETNEYNAYVQVTTGGAAGDDDSNTLYMVALPDQGVVRLQQDVVDMGTFEHYITYSPFFMRLFDGPYETGRRMDFTHQRCEFAATDGSPRGTPTTRRYKHEVIASDESVEVVQGSHDAVLHMKRSDLGDGDYKEFWYVENVGKVREEAYDKVGTLLGTEELAEFVEGTESCD